MRACPPPPPYPQEPWRRERVWQLARRLGRELGVPVCSPIVPLIVGPEQAAVDASAALLQRGLHVPAIRPPTVPRGTSRLRVSLSAAHSGGDLDQLLAALRACGLRFRGVDAVLGGAAAAALQAGAAAAEAAATAGVAAGAGAAEGQDTAAADPDETAGLLAAPTSGCTPRSRL